MELISRPKIVKQHETGYHHSFAFCSHMGISVIACNAVPDQRCKKDNNKANIHFYIIKHGFAIQFDVFPTSISNINNHDNSKRIQDKSVDITHKDAANIYFFSVPANQSTTHRLKSVACRHRK